MGFQIGELIIYGNKGVCRVEEISRHPAIFDKEQDVDYYTLAPLYKQGQVYAPVDTTVFMRRIISREEAMALIARIPEIDDTIFENRNIRILSEQYTEAMRSHDCADLVRVVKAVEHKRKIMIDRGKKLGQVDEKFYKKALEFLHGEFSAVLGIPREDVDGFIRGELEKLA